MARTMGAPPWRRVSEGVFVKDEPLDSYGPSLTLGGYGETPLQMATGASVLAAKGILHPAFSITRVVKNGAVVFDHKPNAGAKRVLDARVAFIMGQIMSDDSNRRLIFRM